MKKKPKAHHGIHGDLYVLCGKNYQPRRVKATHSSDRSPAAAPGEHGSKEVCRGKRKEARKQDGYAGDDGRVQELGTPGAPHKVLASMAESWITKTKGWMEPNKPPMESKGACEQKMILGGRFLQQEYTGDMMGSPFTGIGVTGYDNHTKKYASSRAVGGID